MKLHSSEARSSGARIALSALLIVSAACRLGTDAGPSEPFAVSMNAANMRPQPLTVTLGGQPTSGVALFTLTGSTLTYDVDLFNIDSATTGTLHIGGTAVTSPAIATLFTLSPPGFGSGAAVRARRLSSSDLTGGITLDSVLKAMRLGNAYVQVATKSLPNGAIRGQILGLGATAPPEKYSALSMSGANERPSSVTTTASGNAHFEGTRTAIRYLVTVSGIDSATAAHIHSGDATVAGPVVVTLFQGTTTASNFTGTLANATFTATDGNVITMDSLLVLMRTGKAYVNVHTKKNPGGEIRSQVQPVNATPDIP